MQYVINSRNVTGEKSVLACVTIEENKFDVVQSYDITVNPSIAHTLEAFGVTFGWKFTKMPSVGDSAYFIMLTPEISRDSSYSLIDLNVPIQDKESFVQALIFLEEFKCSNVQQIENIVEEAYRGVSLMFAYSKVQRYAPIFTGTARLGDKSIPCANDTRIKANSVMNSPLDEVSFRVPRYVELLKIYKDVDEDTESYEDSVEESSEETGEFSSVLADTFTYASVGPIISKDLVRVDTITPYYDSYYIRDIHTMLNDFDLEDVLGHSSNNMLPVQENEKKYFEQLQMLVNDGVRYENRVLSNKAVNDIISKGTKSTIVDMYLRDLCEYAYNLTRTHTGYVSTTETVTEVSDEDTDQSQETEEISTELRGFYRLERKPGTDKYIKKGITLNEAESLLSDTFRNVGQGWVRLTNFMTNFVSNSYGWCEAAIKLLRWGSRKPVILSIENAKKDGIPIYFNLENTEYTGFNGDIKNLKPIVYSNGSIYRLIGLIVAEGTIEDVDELSRFVKLGRDLSYDTNIRLPLGIVAQTGYEGTDYVTNTYIDIMQLYEDLRHKKNIGGLRIVDGKIIDDSEDKDWWKRQIGVGSVISKLSDNDSRVFVRVNSRLFVIINNIMKLSGKSIVLKQNTMNIFKIASLMFLMQDVEKEFTLGTVYSIDSVNKRLEYKQQLRDLYGEEAVTPMNLAETYLVKIFAPVLLKYWDRGVDVDNFDIQLCCKAIDESYEEARDEIIEDTDSSTVSSEFLEGFKSIEGVCRIVKDGQVRGYIGLNRHRVKYIFAPDECQIPEKIQWGPNVEYSTFVDKMYIPYMQLRNTGNTSGLLKLNASNKIASNKTLVKIKG